MNPGLRVDRGAALLASMFANLHYKRKDGEQFTVDDFMPFVDERPIDLNVAMETWK